MDMDTRSLVLTSVVCGCCAILCIVMVYLCIVVRRIRRDLKDLTKNQGLTYIDPNDNRQEKVNKEENDRKRDSSSANRYVPRPTGKANTGSRPHPSSMHLDPEETVTVLNRPDEQQPAAPTHVPNPSQAADSRQEQIELHQFTNKSFDPDMSRDQRDSTTSESSGDAQPIYNNEAYEEEEQPIYENNELTDEPLYQNRGDIAFFNNPERGRLQTLDISDVA